VTGCETWRLSLQPTRTPAYKTTNFAVLEKNFAATLNAHLAGVGSDKPVEIWFQDEMRLGQKNGLVRVWARRGSRPRQPADQRRKTMDLFGAVCPARGTGAAPVKPHADLGAMQHHLDEIARTVAPGAHAVLLLDRAGWHTTARLKGPQEHHADLPALPRTGAQSG